MKKFKSLLASLLMLAFLFTGITLPLQTTTLANAKTKSKVSTHAKKTIKKKVTKSKAKKAVVVYITRTGSKYHRAGCQYLRKSCIEIKKPDAISEGYTPCSRCNP